MMGWVGSLHNGYGKPISRSLLGFSYKMNQNTVGSVQKGFLQKGGVLVRDGRHTAWQCFPKEATRQNHLEHFQKIQIPHVSFRGCDSVAWSRVWECGFFNRLPRWLGNTARVAPDRGDELPKEIRKPWAEKHGEKDHSFVWQTFPECVLAGSRKGTDLAPSLKGVPSLYQWFEALDVDQNHLGTFHL